MRTPASRIALSLAMVATMAACGTDTDGTGDRTAVPVPEDDTMTAGDGGIVDDRHEVTFDLIDASGTAIGTARLTDRGEGVSIAIEARGLPPGPKGFHFHEVGRCDPPAFESAGGHFAPEGRQHGLDNPQGPHAGDMENLVVGGDGTVSTTIVNPRVTLRRGVANSLYDSDGTALVIHAGEDDQRTDPTGDSGDRIACGVVPPNGATSL
jgi:superoxide dismutase, Cu-Zn family